MTCERDVAIRISNSIKLLIMEDFNVSGYLGIPKYITARFKLQARMRVTRLRFTVCYEYFQNCAFW